ncbi:MAG: helix-turn-helix transcriptional regulator [Clostridium sp.]|nr:helix-turn-helix transcriptional regulator [Clostridium sp.]
MENKHSLQYKNQSREQLHPDLIEDFPYVMSLVEIDKYKEGFVPWHWHEEVELFYIENGVLEYDIPKGKIIFPKGSGGLVNSNVLHMTKPLSKNTIQHLHIFDTSLIGGKSRSRIEKKYIMPIVTASQIEIVPLFPDRSGQMELLEEIRKSFQMAQDEFCYEIKLREMLSKIWCEILGLLRPLIDDKVRIDNTSDKIKVMMIYIHEHYAEKLSVEQIASAAFISDRECFRVFHDYLHLTPMEYLRSYRLQKACHMLSESSESITVIGQACGFGNNSYFGKIFRENIGCTPQKYRQNGGIAT